MNIATPYTEAEKEILKKSPKFFEPLDAEEEELIRSIDAWEWIVSSSEELKKIKKAFAESSVATFGKKWTTKRSSLTLRVPDETVDIFKELSDIQGIPYQTLAVSALYQYAKKEKERLQTH